MNRAVCLVVILLVITLSTGTLGDHDISIYSFPSPAYFTDGTSLMITCEYPNELTFTHWSHPTAGNITTTQSPKFTIQHFAHISKSQVSVTVSNPLNTDAGEYRCFFRAGDGSVHHSPPLSALYRSPIVTLSPSRNYILKEGSDITLNCDALHADSRQWLKLTHSNAIPKPVRPSSNGRITISHDLRLRIRNIQLEDTYLYRCVLRNTLGTARIEVNVTVVRLPSITVQPQDQYEPLDSMATFSITVRGSHLSYQWFFYEMELRDIRGVVTGSTSNILMIHRVSDRNIGSYRCFVKNFLQNVTSNSVRLVILTLPRIWPLLNRNPLEGSNATLNCIASSPDGILNVTWVASNDEMLPIPLPEPAMMQGENFTNVISSITLFNVRNSMHAGIYTCMATNRIGNTSRTMRLLVISINAVTGVQCSRKSTSGRTRNTPDRITSTLRITAYERTNSSDRNNTIDRIINSDRSLFVSIGVFVVIGLIGMGTAIIAIVVKINQLKPQVTNKNSSHRFSHKTSPGQRLAIINDI